jgi:hypothetical protein
MNPARFARETYQMVEKGSKDDRINKINENIKDTGYKAIKDKSNRDVVYFQNDDTKQVHISNRGTSTNSKKTKSDITADVLFGLGAEKHSKHFKKTANRNNNLVKQTPKEYEISMSGHSLGGGLANETMKTKKHVRERVKKVDTFNGAFSPFTKKTSKKLEQELKNKITNHRTNNDPVSASSVVNSVGKIKTYKPKSKTFSDKIPTHLQHAFTSLDLLNSHSIDNFIK